MIRPGSDPRTQLQMSDGGRWFVQTETAGYLLDLDEGTAVRHPGRGAGAVEGAGPVRTAALRRDGEVLVVVALLECRLGERLSVLLDLGLTSPEGDPVLTYRLGTFVRTITAS